MTTSIAEDVSRETMAAFGVFEQLVRRWTERINLVSKASLLDLRNRHTLDSAQLFRFMPQGAKHWVDLGSGGGFPGVVIAIMAKELAPDLCVSLIESDARKATFLRVAAAELQLSIDVKNERIDALPEMQADVVSARALAPLVDLLALAQRHLKPDGTAILPKGAVFEQEIADAAKRWTFELETHPSQTASEGAILLIRTIRKREQG